MSKDLVSTIIPVYNRASLLVEAVDSVLAQTYRPIEIIIVDDGSTDDTRSVADRLAREYPREIRVLQQRNGGPGSAREAGRLRAKGEFIQYLDSDDLLLPQKFEWQTEGLKTNLDCGVSYGKTRYSRIKNTERENSVPWKRTGEKITFMFPAFLRSRWWDTSTPLYRREVVEKSGPWKNLCNEEDWEYDCRIASQGVRLHYVPRFVSEQRDHAGERLSRNGSTDRKKLQHRTIAHTFILQHAQKAGIDETFPEMRHFARELFLLSRQCGAVGLAKESKQLFALARIASGKVRGRAWDFRCYHFLASIVGWSFLGKFCCHLDRFRK